MILWIHLLSFIILAALNFLGSLDIEMFAASLILNTIYNDRTQKEDVTLFFQQFQFYNKNWRLGGKGIWPEVHMIAMSHFFFFLCDHKIKHHFLGFVVNLITASLSTLNQCFNCSNSLSKFSCEFCKISKNIVFVEHLRASH